MLKLSLRDLRAHVGRYVLTFLAVDDRRRRSSPGSSRSPTRSAHPRRPVRRAQPRHRRGRARRRPVRARTPSSAAPCSGPASTPSSPTTWPRSTGVAAAEGYMQGYARPIVGPTASPFGNPTFGLPDHRHQLGRGRRAQPVRASSRGEPPEGRDEIAFDKRTADGQPAIAVGDTVSVQTARRRQLGADRRRRPLRQQPTAPAAPRSRCSTATRPELLAGPGEVDQVSVDGRARRRARPSCGTRWPTPSAAGPRGRHRRRRSSRRPGRPRRRRSPACARSSSSFALISVLVGTFVIYTSFSFIVAQRQRAGGAAAGHRRRAGPGAGVGGARVAGRRRRWRRCVGYVARACVLASGARAAFLPGRGGMRPTRRSWWPRLAVGTVVTVVSAFFPAARASRVPARGGHARRRHRHQPPVDRPAWCSASCSGCPGWRCWAPASPAGTSAASSPLRVAGAGMLCVFLALIVAAPLAARPASLGLGTPLPRLRGIVGRLAQQNAARNPKRTAVHRLGADDRARDRVAVPRGQRLAAGLARRHDRQPLPGRPRRRQRRRVRGRRAAGCRAPTRSAPCPRWPRPPACGSGSPRSTGPRSPSAGFDPDTAFDLFDVRVTDGDVADLEPERHRGVRRHGRSQGLAGRRRGAGRRSARPVSSRSRWPCCSTART